MVGWRRRVIGLSRRFGPRRRSPWVGSVLSFLWPGLGQLVLGRRAAAILLAVPTLLVTAWVVLQLTQGALLFAVSLWDESYALLVVAAICVSAVLRVGGIGHAFVVAIQGRRPRILDAAVAAVLVVAVVGSHGYLASNVWAWYEASAEMQSNNMIGPDASQKPDLFAAASPASPVPLASDVFLSTATPDPAASPTRAPNPNRVTVLVIGLDDAASLTDTLMVVSVDKSTGKVAMVSVPRDTSNFDLYYGGHVGPTFKLNTLLNSVTSGRLPSPDPPAKTLEKEIGFLVGIPVDYYAAMNFGGFASMINAVGGIDLVMSAPIDDAARDLHLPAGPVHLDGATALKFVRAREYSGGSDYIRAARQQLLLVALEHKVASPSGIWRFNTLLSFAGKAISTDFPLKDARDYVPVAENLASIENCVMGPPYSVHPDTASTDGTWTSRLDMARVANLSAQLFGEDSAYYGKPGVVPAACGK